MPGRQQIPSFQLPSGTTAERDGSYNLTTVGNIFYNTDTSNVEIRHEDPNNSVDWRDLVVNNKEQIDISGKLVVKDDVSFNAHLSVLDASFQNDVDVEEKLVVKDDVSFNAHLSVLDASFQNDIGVGGNLFVGGFEATIVRGIHLEVTTATGLAGNASYINYWETPVRYYQSQSRLHIEYSVTARNDNHSWGGLYTEIYYRYTHQLSSANNMSLNTWHSLGNAGHTDVMLYGSGGISLIKKSYLLDFATTFPTDFLAVQFKVTHKAYYNTTHINQNAATTAGVGANVSNTQTNRLQNSGATMLITEYGPQRQGISGTSGYGRDAQYT